MTDRYPKSREELLVENEQLLAAVKLLTDQVGELTSALGNSRAETAILRRRQKPPRVLSADAADKFSRPAFTKVRA